MMEGGRANRVPTRFDGKTEEIASLRHPDVAVSAKNGRGIGCDEASPFVMSHEP
jgi:hypothetical protein